MRAFAPCANVSIDTTGVPKSCTSSRRSRLRGSEALMKSTISWRPCWRMSMPVALSERSTMIRPSPLRPRRKSTSRSECATSPGRASANRCTTCVRASCCAAWSYSVTTTALPSTVVSKVCGRFRLNTTRVRLPDCTTLKLRSATSSIVRCAAPRPFAVSRKSSAIRGGLAIAKPAGGFAGGDFSAKRTMVLPEAPFETVTCSMLFAPCANVAVAASASAAAASARHARVIAAPRMRVVPLIVSAPVSSDPAAAAGASSCARSSPPRRPARVP